MAHREVQRRREQNERDRDNRSWRGVEMFAPSGVESGYYEGVYPVVSRRGRVMPNSAGSRYWFKEAE